MSVIFPSAEFFAALQQAMEADPSCTEGLDPSDAYCGFAVDDRLFVFEFDGRTCAGAMAGGNELDLDFVVAGPAAVWKRALDAVAAGGGPEDANALPALVACGDLEIRAQDDDGLALAQRSLPFLQAFFAKAREFAVEAA